MRYWLKVWWLKQKAKHYHKKATLLPDHVDCGLAMYHIIRPDLAACVHRFNETMDELSKYDETCPTYRLKEL